MRLVDDETSLQLLDTSSASSFALIQSHVLSPLVVQDRVDEVASISMSSLGNLLQSAQIVHPVQLGAVVDLIPSAKQNVHLEWASRSEGGGQLASQEIGSGFKSGGVSSSELVKLQISEHEVSVLVAISLLTSGSHDGVRVELRNLVISMGESEDRAVQGSVRADNSPALAAKSESRVHS